MDRGAIVGDSLMVSHLPECLPLEVVGEIFTLAARGRVNVVRFAGHATHGVPLVLPSMLVDDRGN